MEVRIVSDPEEKKACYDLRYRVLRAPWAQPQGSETDNLEEDCLLVAALVEGVTAGTVRIQFNGPDEAQLRYMAVDPVYQGRGVGKVMEKFACDIVRQAGRNKILLQARENALPFYLSAGYTVVEKSYLLFGEIQHFLMIKHI